MKDFIKQDALEKSFLNEKKDISNHNIKLNKSSTNLKIINISKDNVITNVNDNSFIEIVDILSDSQTKIVDAKKKKFVQFHLSKSPHLKNFINENDIRIKVQNYKVENIIEHRKNLINLI
jgi:hypothetical protein